MNGKGDWTTIYKMVLKVSFVCDGCCIKDFDHNRQHSSRANQKYLVYPFNLSTAMKASGMNQGGKFELAAGIYAEDEMDIYKFKSPSCIGVTAIRKGPRGSPRSQV